MQDHDNRISPSGKIRYIIVDRGHETPCWEWQMAMTEKGYAQVNINGRTRRAHRVYFESRHGRVPDGMVIDHLCRNRRCVNPDHMEAVTSAENIRRGDGAKLSYEQVDEIRSLRGKRNQREIGDMFGVHRTVVGRIWSGDRWSSTLVAERDNRSPEIPFLRRISAKHVMSCVMGTCGCGQNADQIKGSDTCGCRIQE